MAPVLRRMYPNSRAGVLGAGRDVGWREFSLVLYQLLQERESPEHLTGHQQHSRASPLAIGLRDLKPAPTGDHSGQGLIASRTFALWSRRCKRPSRSSDITSHLGRRDDRLVRSAGTHIDGSSSEFPPADGPARLIRWWALGSVPRRERLLWSKDLPARPVLTLNSGSSVWVYPRGPSHTLRVWLFS